ncbi:DUF5615 family PIN-like protein [Methylotuvimicrobium sp. KM2]|uniref:DUF5615 family PIN-like protein n=1 Tax=Methylotuvimicrobium sp. KM2 TaxID=3133976 RepID=UPI0031015EB4
MVSKDSDFYDKSALLGYPPKVIWIRRGIRPISNFQLSDYVPNMNGISAKDNLTNNQANHYLR